MMSVILTLVLAFLAVVGRATTSPQYQKPTTVTAVSYAGVNVTTCGNSNYTLLSGQGNITASDCSSIIEGWATAGNFDLLASGWVDSTGDSDHFYIYETQGSCEFAFKRTDGLQDQVTIGSSDLEDFVTNAIIRVQGTPYISPVAGVVSCRSDNGPAGAEIEWTIRNPL